MYREKQNYLLNIPWDSEIFQKDKEKNLNHIMTTPPVCAGCGTTKSLKINEIIFERRGLFASILSIVMVVAIGIWLNLGRIGIIVLALLIGGIPHLLLRVKPVKIRHYICSSCIDKSKLLRRGLLISLVLFLFAGMLFAIAGLLAGSIADSVSDIAGSIVGIVGFIGAILLIIYSIFKSLRNLRKRIFWVTGNKKVLKLHATSKSMVSKLEKEI